MATYNIDDVVVSALQVNDIINCDYSGSVKNLTLPAGQYKFECWGAQGGHGIDVTLGHGGYSVGKITIKHNTTLYFYVGGTDIRISSTSLYARVIVASGGGGIGYNSTPGVGGGLVGGDGNTTGKTGLGGTQTAGGASAGTKSTAGSFGQGGNGQQDSYAAAGGGGGWYGGSSGYVAANDGGYSGGGGSGYVYTSSTASNYPFGCLLNSSYYLTDASTIGGNQSITEPNGTSVMGHSGNGYIRITVLEISSGGGGINGKVNVGGTWNNISNMYVKVNNVWNSVTEAYIKKNGEWLSVGGGGPTPTTYTVRIAPTSYTYINTQPSVTNPDNMYTNTDSDTYADVFVRSKNTILKLTGFDISTIPSNATVTSFTVKTKASGTNVYCYYNPSYVGKQSANINLSSTATTYSFDNGNITWDDLKTNFNSSHTALDVCFKSSSGFSTFSIYGAEIEVTYEL